MSRHYKKDQNFRFNQKYESLKSNKHFHSVSMYLNYVSCLCSMVSSLCWLVLFFFFLPYLSLIFFLLRNNSWANERNRSNETPRNFHRSTNFERRGKICRIVIFRISVHLLCLIKLGQIQDLDLPKWVLHPPTGLQCRLPTWLHQTTTIIPRQAITGILGHPTITIRRHPTTIVRCRPTTTIRCLPINPGGVPPNNMAFAF